MNPQWFCLWIVCAWPACAIMGQGQTASPGAELHRLAPQTAKDLQTLLSPSHAQPPRISAHRGGPGPGLPENCLATFEATLRTTAAMLEIDPRLTRDGVVVLHHDDSLERTTTGQGLVANHTWEQLQTLRLKDSLGQVTEHSMSTLEQAIEWARGRTILVLDQKDTPLKTRVDMVTQLRAESFVILIVGKIDDMQTCQRLNPDIMMEVFIGDRAKFEQFDQAGIAWRNIIAFVGHTPPQDPELLQMIHAKGALCMAGTSRNIDRQFIEHPEQGIARLQPEYQHLLHIGVDVIETDIPRQVGPLLASAPQSRSAPRN